jgi:hypothetical protein
VLTITGKEGDMFKRGAVLISLEQKSIQAPIKPVSLKKQLMNS